MLIENAKRLFDGSIQADFNGVSLTVPDDMANSHRQELAEWEAAGNAIAPYEAPPAPIPDRVTARQFKLQLLAAGYLDAVEAWIATQPRAVQIAYANSGTFVRDEPMLQAGFSALGFTHEQGDAFFTAAAAL